jgi:UDP-N-acetylmuramoyl-tripeptide--D-alanyl-D-alanine ligase
MRLSEIARMLRGQLIGKDVAFQGASIDSRKIQPKQLFAAIKGTQTDGHEYLGEAIKKGAAAALVAHPVVSDLPQVVVHDVRIALGEIASYYRNQLQMPIIGLTGSCGKTTTKSLIANILCQSGKVHATEGTLNNDYGMPLTLLGAKSSDDYVVLEMGANHLHEIAYLTYIARPTIALITNAGPVHLEGFGSVDGVAAGKAEIFQGLTDNGIAIINLDDHYAEYWLQQVAGHPYITFGLTDRADVYATEITLNSQGEIGFTLHTLSGNVQVRMSLMGEHNVLNALAAAAVAVAAGISLENIQRGLESATTVDKRLTARKGFNGVQLIDDTYNANPVAMEMALKVLSGNAGEKVFVVGDMGELGTNAEFYHKEVGRKAKQYGIDRLYAVGSLSRAVVEGFGEHAQHFPDQSALIAALQSELRPQVTILVKGSRSAKMENVVAALESVSVEEL